MKKTDKKTENEIVFEYLNNVRTLELSNKYNIHRTTVQRILLKNGVVLRKQDETAKKYKINETYFKNLDDSNKLYILGLIYSDGNIFKNLIDISLQDCDKEILEKISEKIYL